MTRERAPAKVNLALHVGARRADGLHELCSLFASIDLTDEIRVRRAAADSVSCPGVAPGANLADAAVRELRRAGVDLPPLRIEIEKRIPLAAGLGGGSADAAAVLRAANRLAGEPLDLAGLRAIGARIGADVPSQIEPRHALVTGAGERVEPVALPSMALTLVPDAEGLSTADVYAEADRIGAPRAELDPDALRTLAGAPLDELAAGLENDLEPAARSLRPQIGERIERLRAEGASAALVTGSGPTVFGVFDHADAAERAASAIPGAVVASLRA